MVSWAIEFITSHSYFAVFALMVLENIIPFIPSEIVLPLIGHIVAENEMNFVLALLAATAGSMLGTSVWFAIGWHMSADQLEKFLKKYGGYIAITSKDFHKARNFFTRYEIPAVFFGRMIPAIRGVVSIPAGSVHMPVRKFLLYSFLGSLIWNAALMFIGFKIFKDFTIVDSYMKPITHAIIILILGTYLLQVARFLWHKRTENKAE